ncbi:MAG: type IX secretion system membrane protein PorP/SprF [Bacteroidia bacterium]|nr:type IX secretion system membrane protein PorP/SprF [Bacteroidia bacterium]
MKELILIVFLFFIVFTLPSQDIHFSQYNGSPLNLSPALCGMYDGDYRLNAIFRSQWQAVPVPYTTISLSAEGKYQVPKVNKTLSLGLVFNNDRAGDAIYSQNQIFLNAAYLQKLNRDSTLLLNTAFGVGYSNTAFNYNRMSFDSQFDGLQYNTSAPTNENFYRTSLHYFDMQAGLALKYLINQKVFIQYALSFFHLNNPVVTYYANTSSRIDKKVSNYLMLQYPLGQKLFILPELLLNFQGKYKEILPGTQLAYLINHLEDIYGRAGVYWRARDAVVLRIGLDYQTTFIGMSYDINTSKFVAATNSRGGFEMYIIHILKKKKNYLSKKKPCPVFM